MKQPNLLSIKCMVICVFAFMQTAYAQWNAIYENDSVFFQEMQFLNPDTGYVVGVKILPGTPTHYNGFILRTLNGGVTWDTVYIPPLQINPAYNYTFRSLFFLNYNVGYVGASPGKIIYTTDAGNNWLYLDFPFIGVDAQRIYCKDENNCMVGKNIAYFTHDGGQSWETDSVLNSFRDISFPYKKKGYAIGYYVWAVTNDSGNTWIEIPVFPGIHAAYDCVYFVSDSLGWIGGMGSQGFPNFNYGNIAKTSDGGQTWTQHDFQYEMRSIADIYFINDTVGWAGGAGQSGNSRQIMKTTDGGEHWYKQFLNYTGPYSGCHQIQFLNDSVGYALTSYQIFRTTNAGGPLIGLDVPDLNEEAELKIFPNPTLSKLNIQTRYDITEAYATNLSGQKTKISSRNFGINGEADISNLSPGLYILEIQTREGLVYHAKIVKE